MQVRLSFKDILRIDGRKYKGVEFFWIRRVMTDKYTKLVTLLQE